MQYKRFFIIAVLALFFAVLLAPQAQAEGPVDVYLFWGDGCPHCAKEKAFLEQYDSEYDCSITVHSFEVWNNRENADLFLKVINYFDVQSSGVPLTVIGGKVVSGYYDDQTTGQAIHQEISECYKSGCEDYVAGLITGNEEPVISGPDEEEDIPEKINLPFIGAVNTSSLSLPVLTILIAAVDGFNPCAMWVLMLLISLLLGMENRRRMWIIGCIFIFASALTYFLFLTAWLNLFIFLGFVQWIRIIIGLVAIGAGLYHLKDYWQNKSGECKVETSGWKQKIRQSLQDITKNPRFLLALLGVIAIAFAVNLVELVCSAGLPAIFTHILSLSNLAGWQYYAYLLLYILIFMLDDLIVFFVAMIALKSVVFTGKYSRFSNLVGGIIILILGILLMFKPEWLMFG